MTNNFFVNMQNEGLFAVISINITNGSVLSISYFKKTPLL